MTSERQRIHEGCRGVARASKEFVCSKCGKEVCPECGETTWQERPAFCVSKKTSRCDGQVIYWGETWRAKQENYLTPRRLARQYHSLLLKMQTLERVQILDRRKSKRLTAKQFIHRASTALWSLRRKYPYLDPEYGCGKDWAPQGKEHEFLQVSVRFERLESKREILHRLEIAR